MPVPKISGYRILSVLGHGGMGAVYRARHVESGGEVALKVMRRTLADDPEFVLRFKREAQALSSVGHPGIARFVAYGQTGDSVFMAMEYIEGESLRKRIDDGPLPVDEACRIAGGIADALEAAHRAGIIHRDVKPSNVILSPSGAKLTDFGLARRTEGSSLTTSGRVMGSLPYMAPERVKGMNVTAASDVYGLGVVLFEMLTGRLPFEAADEEAMATRILTLPAPILSRYRRDAPVGLDLLVIKMLSKQPELRPASAAAVAESLKEFPEGRAAAAGSVEGIEAEGLASRVLCRISATLLGLLPLWKPFEPLAAWAERKGRLAVAPGTRPADRLEGAGVRRRIRRERRMLRHLAARRDKGLSRAREAHVRAGTAGVEQSQDLARLAKELRMEAEVFEGRIAELTESIAENEKRALRFEERARP